MPLRLPTSHASPWSGRGEAATVFLLCLAVRLATTIRHIEDADSLRFALGVLDFDVARLQPQFPGYPAFMGAAKLLHALTGSYALAFSALGGIGLFVLIHYALALAGWRFRSPRGLLLAALFVFNPMIWLLGNRYMSDLSGAACLLAAFYHLTRHLGRDASGPAGRRHAAAGFFLAGLLAGWRLSFAPFLLLPLIAGLAPRAPVGTGPPPRTFRVAERVLAGAAGVLVWLIPFIAVTGWNALLATARAQTGAHFTATGGTYVTESAWPLRARRIVEYLWTDGLGAWAPDRDPVTALVGVGALIFLGLGVAVTLHARRGGPWPRALVLLAASCAVYALWILLFQNVVHQTRHVLPLVPPLLMLLAAGLAPATPTVAGPHRSRYARALRRAGVALFLAAYAATGVALAVQHTRPAAIAQVVATLREHPQPDALLVGAPWVVKCLSAQGVRGPFFAVETAADLDSLRRLDPARAVVTVGDYSDRIDRPPARRETFYHNPYVNRLGARVDVLRYAPAPPTPPVRP